MMRRHEISSEEYKKIAAAEKGTQDKKISRKLKVLMLRYEGLDNKTIAERLGLSSTRVTHLVSQYTKKGLDDYIQKKYGGNHRNMSEGDENAILDEFKTKAEAGQVITAKEIKKKLDAKLGRDTGRSYVYMLLARHDWRKIMPRSKHPKKADDATIAASKKLKTL